MTQPLRRVWRPTHLLEVVLPPEHSRLDLQRELGLPAAQEVLPEHLALEDRHDVQHAPPALRLHLQVVVQRAAGRRVRAVPVQRAPAHVLQHEGGGGPLRGLGVVRDLVERELELA